MFGNSTAQSRGMHTPVQPLNSSPSLRAQVPPQFISPQVSNCMFSQLKVKTIKVVISPLVGFVGIKGALVVLNLKKTQMPRIKIFKTDQVSLFVFYCAYKVDVFTYKTLWLYSFFRSPVYFSNIILIF